MDAVTDLTRVKDETKLLAQDLQEETVQRSRDVEALRSLLISTSARIDEMSRHFEERLAKLAPIAGERTQVASQNSWPAAKEMEPTPSGELVHRLAAVIENGLQAGTASPLDRVPQRNETGEDALRRLLSLFETALMGDTKPLLKPAESCGEAEPERAQRTPRSPQPRRKLVTNLQERLLIQQAHCVALGSSNDSRQLSVTEVVPTSHTIVDGEVNELAAAVPASSPSSSRVGDTSTSLGQPEIERPEVERDVPEPSTSTAVGDVPPGGTLDVVSQFHQVLTQEMASLEARVEQGLCSVRTELQREVARLETRPAPVGISPRDTRLRSNERHGSPRIRLGEGCPPSPASQSRQQWPKSRIDSRVGSASTSISIKRYGPSTETDDVGHVLGHQGSQCPRNVASAGTHFSPRRSKPRG